MSGDGNILCLLDCLGMQEGKATLAYRADDGEIWEWGGLQGDMNDDWGVR